MKKTISIILLVFLFPSLVSAEGYYFHEDHLGGSSIITNEDGEVVAEYNYMPYGELFDEVIYDEDFSNSYKFTDQEEDSETGLYYYGARYYGSSVGRFMAQDPAVYDERLFDLLQDPQSLNAYAYVRNNPVKYVDPNGEFAWFAALVIAVTVAITTFTDVPTANAPSESTPIVYSTSEKQWYKDRLVEEVAGAVAGASLEAVAGPILKGIGSKVDDIATTVVKSVDEVGDVVCHSTKKFTFGHGARHLEGTGLSQEMVENTIKNDIDLNVDVSVEGFFTGQVKVGGETIEYRAFNRDNGVTNVGTYFIKND